MNRIFIIVALALAALPLILPGSYLIGISVLVAIFSLAAIGVDLLFGYAGQLSLGQAAFMGLGAYTTAILTVRGGLPPLAATGVGVVISVILAGLIGRPVLKLRGYYLVLASLALGLIFEILLVGWRDFTGGPSGFSGVPSFSAGITFGSDIEYHYLVWSLVLATLWTMNNLSVSRTGRALKALAADDVAAGVLGMDVPALKLKVFMISAALASVSGSLYAHYMQFVSPEMVGLQTSFALVTMVALGGAGQLWGSVVGVALLKLLPEVIGWLRDYQLIIHGLILMVLMVRMPAGIIGAVRKWISQRGGAGDLGIVTNSRSN